MASEKVPCPVLVNKERFSSLRIISFSYLIGIECERLSKNKIRTVITLSHHRSNLAFERLIKEVENIRMV